MSTTLNETYYRKIEDQIFRYVMRIDDTKLEVIFDECTSTSSDNWVLVLEICRLIDPTCLKESYTWMMETTWLTVLEESASRFFKLLGLRK